MSEVVYFSTKEVKIKFNLINIVVLCPGRMIDKEVDCFPYVVINDNYLFYANRGFTAIYELLQIGFYNKEEYKISTKYFKELMSPYPDKC